MRLALESRESAAGAGHWRSCVQVRGAEAGGGVNNAQDAQASWRKVGEARALPTRGVLTKFPPAQHAAFVSESEFGEEHVDSQPKQRPKIDDESK